MITDEILKGIKSVFKHDYDLLLSPQEMYDHMKHKGFFKSVEYKKAIVEIRIRLESPTFYHRIVEAKGAGITKDGWMLARQFGVADFKDNQQDDLAFQLQINKEFRRTISAEGAEIEDGTIPLRGDFYSFFVSMDTSQQRQMSIDVIYYASEHVTCKIEQDDRGRWSFKSDRLKDWYKENCIEPGDEIQLVIEATFPLAIGIYTEWERNSDTYRRHRQLQSDEPILSIDMPIRDIIWDFLDKTQKIEHRLDIGKAILEKRPEVSEQSVYACLSANPYLFVRVGEGNWGLKEWGLEEVTATKRPIGSTLEEDPNLATEIIPLDYILANIASENLVYRILKENPRPLTVTEITERVSKILHVNKGVLVRATFFDPSDPRFYRQEDGTFILRDKLEEVIHSLAEKERKLKISLENEIHALKATAESLAGQYEKKASQLKEERDLLQKIAEEWIERYGELTIRWDKRTQLLLEFFKEATPNIGQGKLKEIFEHLHNHTEMRDSNEPF